jgi:mannose/cellobiose epimerase-like protein (N-acyl-D-glucosamine 2-epimerase family)
MFVLLAASTAMDLGMKGADQLFSHVDSIIDQHFWDPQFKMMSNEWSEDFSEQDTYRGINANMHAVEALLAAFDVTGKTEHLKFQSELSINLLEITSGCCPSTLIRNGMFYRSLILRIKPTHFALTASQ